MTGAPVDAPQRRLALAAMVAAVAIVTLDTTILNVAIPTIRRDLHTTLTSLQWVIAGYSLTLGALLVIGGRIGDVVGTRRTFVAGAAVFAGGSLLASIATTTPELVLGEAVLEGIGASLLFPASLATLSTVFEGPARAKAFALWGGVAGAAAALGPVIGGWLTTDYSWRWGFRINVVVAPLAALAALVALPRDDRGHGRRPRLDVKGALLLATGLFLVVFALTEAPDHGWVANRGPGLALRSTTLWSSSWPLSPVLAAAGVALVALTAFIRLERNAATGDRDPLVDVRLFASRAFGGGLLTAAVVVIAQAGTMFVLAVFLQTTHHLTPVAAGRWVLPVGAAALIGAQIGGAIAASVGPTIVVRTGILVQLAGIVAAAAVLRTDVTAVPLGAALGVFGLGAGMASSQLTNVILSEVGRERAGSASGVATTNNALSAALGVAVLGGVLRLGTFADAGSARWALFAAAALLAAGSAVSFRIPVRRPSDGQPAGGQPVHPGLRPLATAGSLSSAASPRASAKAGHDVGRQTASLEAMVSADGLQIGGVESGPRRSDR